MKRTLSLFLTTAILLTCVSFGFTADATGAQTQSLTPFNTTTFRRPSPDIALYVTEVIRVGASGDTTMDSGTMIKKATASGVPYIVSAYASQAYAGETPNWPSISFSSSDEVSNVSVTITGPGAAATASFNGGSTSNTTGAAWEIRGGTAEAGTTLKIAVSYTYTWQDPFTGVNVTDTYKATAYSYVENIVFPSGVWAFAYAGTQLSPNDSADVVYVSRLLGKGVYSEEIGRDADNTAEYSAGYHGFIDNEHVDESDTTIPKKTMLLAEPEGEDTGNNFIADGRGVYPTDTDRGKSTVYLDTSTQTLTSSNFRMHFFIHSDIRCGSGYQYYEGRAVKDGNVSYTGGTGAVTGSDTAAAAALNPSAAPGSATDFNTAGMQTTTTLRGSGAAGSYTLITKWKAKGDAFGPFGDTPYMHYYHAVMIELVNLDKGTLRTNLNSSVGVSVSNAVTYIKTVNGSDPANGGITNSNKGKNPQSWYYTGGWPDYETAYESAWQQMQKPNTGQAAIDTAAADLPDKYSPLTLRGANYTNSASHTLENGLGNTLYGSSVKPLSFIFNAVNTADTTFSSKLKYWKAGTFDYYTDITRNALNEALSAANACISVNYNVLYQLYVDYVAYRLKSAVDALQLKQNQIAFHPNGGSGTMTPQIAEAGSVVALNVNTYGKTGYTFKGWALTSGGAVVYQNASAFEMGGVNVLLYAVWTNIYTITFNANGGNGTVSEQMTLGTPLTAPEVTRAGYTFTKWQPAVPATVPEGDTTYTAQWSINQYSVSFDSNGGSAVAYIKQNYGSAVSKPADPARNGFTFSGWYSDPELTQAVTWPFTLGAADTACYAKWSGIYYSKGDRFTFGTYPQSKVTDLSLIAVLNELTTDVKGDAEYEGEKYRRVYFEEYTPIVTGLAPDAEHSYQDNNGYFFRTVYWFKYEPVQWRVLNRMGDEMFVMAENILDAGAYNQEASSVTWETCPIREWLKDDFCITAFSSEDRKKLLTSSNYNLDNPWHGTDGGNTTEDKLFILSYDEATYLAYGFNIYSVADEKRMARGTDFAKCNGLGVQADGAYAGNSYWWLRTPQHYPDGALTVLSDGVIFDNSSSTNFYNFVGVRPVFKINRSTLMLETVEGSGCVIDRENMMIYGLEANLTQESFESDFVRVVGDGTLQISSDSGIFGTGTVVEVYNNLTSTVMETYTVVVFGDVNGDGAVDTNDEGWIIDLSNYKYTALDPAGDAAVIKAGDLFRDGVFDENDACIIMDVLNGSRTIIQSTGEVKPV